MDSGLQPILDNLSYLVEYRISRYGKIKFEQYAGSMWNNPQNSFNVSWAALIYERYVPLPNDLKG